MKINRRLMRIAFVSMVVALILTIFTYSTIKKAAQPEVTENIAFFKKNLERDTIVKEGDLDIRSIPKSLVPIGVVRNKTDVIDKRLTIDVTAGDFALENNFITRGDIRVDVNDMWIISIEIDNIANFIGAQLREGEDYALVFLNTLGESRLLNKVKLVNIVDATGKLITESGTSLPKAINIAVGTEDEMKEIAEMKKIGKFELSRPPKDWVFEKSQILTAYEIEIHTESEAEEIIE